MMAPTSPPRRKAGRWREPTIDFGCPVEHWAHHVAVHVSEQRGAPIVLVEEYGIAARNGPERIERGELSRERWDIVAPLAKQMLNERLRVEHLAPSRWHVGVNKVERLLGKELLVLVWAVDAADGADVAAIAAAWMALRPEERWWLYGKVAAVAGTSAPAHAGSKIRRGLALLLSGGPGTAPRGSGSQRRTSTPEDGAQLSLLAEPPED